MRQTKYWKGLKFTGDTNCGISWQAGMDTADCPDYPNTNLNFNGRRGTLNFSGLALGGGLLGVAIGVKTDKEKAKKAAETALAEVRNLFPGAGSCPTGTESLSVYLGNAKWSKAICNNSCDYIVNAIRSMQTALNDFHIPRNDTYYIAAYNQVISEYSDYYNANCIVSTPPTLPPVPKDATTNGASAGSSSGGTSITGGGSAGSTPASTTQPSINGTPIAAAASTTFSKIPTWAWWVGGGLVAVIVVVSIAKH